MGKNYIIIFILLFALINNLNISSSQSNNNEGKSDNNEKDKKNNDKNNDKDQMELQLNELLKKSQNTIDEGNKLEIQKEIYRIYLRLLIILNIIFALILITYIVYKLYYSNKNKNKKQSLNLIEYKEIHEEREEKNNNKIGECNPLEERKASYEEYNREPSVNSEKFLNTSGYEAPTVEKYYNQNPYL